MCKCQKTRQTNDGFERRKGKLAVALSTCCTGDPARRTYCLDVSEYARKKGGECVENDHDTSSVPLTASKKQIKAYLTAAIAAASGAHSVTGSVRRLAATVDLAGSCAIPGAS